MVLRKIQLLLTLFSLLVCMEVKSQGFCLSQCATGVVAGLDSLAKGLNTWPCSTGVTVHRIHLPPTCALPACTSTVARRIFASINTGPYWPNTSYHFIWAFAETVPSHWSYHGYCAPMLQSGPPTTPVTPADEYPYFPSCGGAVTNNMDAVAIKRILGNSFIYENVTNVIAISNPRMATPLDVWWNLMNLSAYNDPYNPEGILVDVTLTGNITYTGMLMHAYSYAYIKWKDACPETFIPPAATACEGQNFKMAIGNPKVTTTYYWDFGDGSSATGFGQSHAYSTAGTYTISCSFTTPSPKTFTAAVQVNSCPQLSCKSCLGSFAPEPGEYLLSAWILEDNANINTTPPTSYPNTGVRISFSPKTGYPPIPTLYNAFGTPGNEIIDGWQRVESSFTVPVGASQIHIELINNNGSGIDSYFDDIRIHPTDANMKSYVYDPITLKLTAELDENNYATFYEYDEEGKLVRIKKESERGRITLKETRSITKKR